MIFDNTGFERLEHPQDNLHWVTKMIVSASESAEYGFAVGALTSVTQLKEHPYQKNVGCFTWGHTK